MGTDFDSVNKYIYYDQELGVVRVLTSHSAAIDEIFEWEQIAKGWIAVEDLPDLDDAIAEYLYVKEDGATYRVGEEPVDAIAGTYAARDFDVSLDVSGDVDEALWADFIGAVAVAPTAISSGDWWYISDGATDLPWVRISPGFAEVANAFLSGDDDPFGPYTAVQAKGNALLFIAFADADSTDTDDLDDTTEFTNPNVSVNYADLATAVQVVVDAGYSVTAGNKYIYYDEELSALRVITGYDIEPVPATTTPAWVQIAKGWIAVAALPDVEDATEEYLYVTDGGTVSRVIDEEVPAVPASFIARDFDPLLDLNPDANPLRYGNFLGAFATNFTDPADYDAADFWYVAGLSGISWYYSESGTGLTSQTTTTDDTGLFGPIATVVSKENASVLLAFAANNSQHYGRD